jgi:hypothetical protein
MAAAQRADTREMSHMFEMMKGTARTMIVGQSPRNGRVELAQFPDGSWAIRKNGPTIGVWEPHEESECFRVFAMLAGVDDPALARGGDDVVVLVRRQAAEDPNPEWN